MESGNTQVGILLVRVALFGFTFGVIYNVIYWFIDILLLYKCYDCY